MIKRLLKILKKELQIQQEDIFTIRGPLDLTFLMKVYGMDGFDHLKEEPYIPQPPKGLDMDGDLFEQIRQKDILLHHPYETFDPVVNFVRLLPKTRMSLRSSRHCTVSAAIRRLLPRWRRRQKMESRLQFWSN